MDTPPVEIQSQPQMERIQSLDLLRGVALCGILVMNITSFALPGTAYSNPTAFGDGNFSNHFVFALTYVFFDQKMMGLFSLLFGAGVMLFMEKARLKGRNATLLHYSRTFWLIVFGLLHSIFIWEGDILFFYGICAIALYFFRWFPAALNLGLGLTIFLSAIMVGEYGQSWVNELPTRQIDSLTWAWQPTLQDLNYEINLRHSSYWDLVRYRWETSEFNRDYPTTFITKVFITQGMLRAFGLMVVGMALYRLDFFRGGSYINLGKLLLALGVVVATIGLLLNYQQQWDIRFSLYHGRLYNHFATPIIVLAYAMLLVHLANTTRSWLIPSIANYGRMAFSNYIMQSVICTYLFYGYGLSWFARFDRWQLMLIVVAILAFQFVVANIWLHFFRFGPLEWIWRLLTYFRVPR